jgi:hypothetical protein
MIRIKAILMAVVACLGLLGCGGGNNDDGGSIRGFLSSSDWVVGNGFFADRYIFHATRDTTVRIDLTSNQFDAYLIVIDEFNNVLEDDDSGPGSDAMLEFFIQAGTEIEVRATSFEPGETGNYELFWSRGLRFDGELRGRSGEQGALSGPVPKGKK